jgi:osmotically-inducible protein OsmY
MSIQPVLIRLMSLSVTLGCSVAGCATDMGCRSEDCGADARITSQLLADIQQHPALEAPNSVRVQTVHGVVYLHGHVDTELQRDEVEALARQVPDVKNVIDSLRLTYAGG